MERPAKIYQRRFALVEMHGADFADKDRMGIVLMLVNQLAIETDKRCFQDRRARCERKPGIRVTKPIISLDTPATGEDVCKLGLPKRQHVDTKRRSSPNQGMRASGPVHACDQPRRHIRQRTDRRRSEPGPFGAASSG